MILIIDGYNVLKQARGAHASESEKQNFIRRLAQYAHEKKHEVILVFDGGHSMYPAREQYQGITVVHAGIHQSADDYIKKLLEKEKGKELLLASSDNELCFFAHRRDVPSIDALAFFGLMQEDKGNGSAKGVARGLQKSTATVNTELDELMAEETKRIPLKKEDGVHKRERSQQVAKHEKKLFKKIKKL